MATGACSSRVPGAWGCSLGVPAPVPGPGLGRRGSWGLRVLLGLGDAQGIPEEEEVPLPRRRALSHAHALAEQRLGRCRDGRALLHGVRVVPAEQMVSGVRKAAAAGPDCAGVSRSCGGSLPGATAAVQLAHPARARRSLAWDTPVGLGTAPSRPERGCQGGSLCRTALLDQNLPLRSTGACWHSAVPAGTGAVAGPAPSRHNTAF